ncbi:MAG: SDR family oxidoreductase [Pseudomonadota bacterium]
MRVLVTGHKGYIGTVLVPMLRARGHAVLGIDSDLYRNSTYGHAPDLVDERIKDVRDIEKEDLDGVDAIVSLAALSNDVLGDFNPDLTYQINHQASVRLAELAVELGIRRYVFASSCSLYGAAGDDVLTEDASFHPVTPYARSKVMVEQDVSRMANDGFSPTFMRNATAYGVSPRMRFDVVLNNLSAWAYTTGQVRMKSDGTPWRPVVHIEDISRAVIAALEAPRETVHNMAINVGRNDENYQVRQLAQIVHDTIPDSEITFAGNASPDLRNYRVNFDRYRALFPAHPLSWTAREGARAILDAYIKTGLNRDDYEGDRYKRIAQLKSLVASRQLDSTLRWAS